MIGIYFSLLLFFVCFIGHVFIHRMRRYLALDTSVTPGAYGIGLALVLFGAKRGILALPITSIALFLFLSLFVIYLYRSMSNEKGKKI